jgi:hypothetical protein
MRVIILALLCLFGTFAKASTIEDRMSCIDNENGSKICHYYFGPELLGVEHYQKVHDLLMDASSSDKIYLHFLGDGGDATSLVYILNAIKSSPADIVTVIDGPVASAHAVLGVAGKEVVISQYGYWYVHNVSISGMAKDLCKDSTGLDRGLSAKNKCLENMPRLAVVFNEAIIPYVEPYLTATEFKAFSEGHDVIISLSELQKRFTFAPLIRE